MSHFDSEGRLLQNSDQEDEVDLFSSASMSTPRKHKAAFFQQPNERSRVASKADSALAKVQRPSGGSNRNMSRANKITRICLLYSAFLGLGLCIALPGPTLLDLGEQTESTTDKLSFLFAGRSFGYMAGSVIGGALLDRINEMLLLGFSLLLTGAATLAFPWTKLLVVAIGLISFQGFAMGILGKGGNAYCARLLGSESPPYLQGLHFAFGVGGFLAPLIAEPFLTETTPKIFVSNGTSELVERSRRDTRGVDNEFVYAAYGNVQPWQDVFKVAKRKDESNVPSVISDERTTVVVQTNPAEAATVIGVTESTGPTTRISSEEVNIITRADDDRSSTTTSTSSSRPTTPSADGTTVQRRKPEGNDGGLLPDQSLGPSSSTVEAVSPQAGKITTESSPEPSPLVTSPASSHSSDNPVNSTSPSTTRTSPSPAQQAVSSTSQPLSSTQDHAQDIPMVAINTTTGKPVLDATVLNKTNTTMTATASSTSPTRQPLHSSSTTSRLTSATLMASSASYVSSDIPVTAQTTSPATAKQVVSSNSQPMTFTQGRPRVTSTTTTGKPVSEATDLNTTSAMTTTTASSTSTTSQPLLGSSEPSQLTSATLISVVSSSSQPMSSTQGVPMTAKPVTDVTDIKTTSTTTTNASSTSPTSQQRPSTTGTPLVNRQFRFHTPYMMVSIFLGLLSVMFLSVGISDVIRLPGANQWMFLRYESENELYRVDSEPRDLGEIKVQTRHSRSTRPSGLRIQLLVLLFLFYLLYVGSEVAFGQFISAYAERAHLWTRRQAAYVAAAFWGALAIGRGAGIYLTRLLRPASMIAMDLTLLTVAMLGMLIGVQSFDTALWVCAAVAGFGMSSIYSSGFSWTERHIPITWNVSSVLVVAGGLGELVLPVAVGFLFVSNPQSLAIFMAAASLLLAALFFLLHNLAFNAEDGSERMAYGDDDNEGGDDGSEIRRQGYDALIDMFDESQVSDGNKTATLSMKSSAVLVGDDDFDESFAGANRDYC